MEQEPADKLLGTYSHLLTFIIVSTISIPEGDQAVSAFHNTMVGNSNTMCITAKIVKHLFWTIERRFGIDNPIFFPELVN